MRFFSHQRHLWITAGILLILGLAGAGYAFLPKRLPPRLQNPAANFSCVNRVPAQFSDSEMLPNFNLGSDYTLYEHFYRCNQLQRGDLAQILFSPNVINVRILWGLPGDRVEVMPFPQETAFGLRINGSFVMEATGRRPMHFSSGRWKGANSNPEVNTIFDRDHFTLGADEFLAFAISEDAKVDSVRYGVLKGSQLIGLAVPENLK